MSAKPVAPDEGKLPNSRSALIAIAAKAGLGVVAGQDIQLANGETIALMSGQDTQFVTILLVCSTPWPRSVFPL